MAVNPLRAQIAQQARGVGARDRTSMKQDPMKLGQNVSDFSAGSKRYGPSQRRGPNTGMSLDRSGYAERDMRHAARRNALLRKMQDFQESNYGSADAQRPLGR